MFVKKKIKIYKKSFLVVILINVVKMYIWFQCDKNKTDTEIKAVKMKAIETIRVVKIRVIKTI